MSQITTWVSSSISQTFFYLSSGNSNIFIFIYKKELFFCDFSLDGLFFCCYGEKRSVFVFYYPIVPVPQHNDFGLTATI